MNTSLFSSAESRLLGLLLSDLQRIQRDAGAKVTLDPNRTTMQTATNTLPSGTPTSTFISDGKVVNSYDTPLPSAPNRKLLAGSSTYNINLDPTYAGTIGAETGYKGDPLTAGNVGPSVGQSWTGGTQRTDGTMAGGSNTSAFKSLSEQADEYARSQNPVPSPYMKGYAEAMVAYNQALQASRAEFIGRKQIEQKKSEADKIREQYAMANSAAGSAQNTPVTTSTTNVPTAPKAPATTPVNSAAAFGAANLTKRLNAMTSRQDFIEQQRAAGMSDTQIREMIRTLPPEQTGGVIPTPSTNAAGSKQAPETTPTPQAPAPTPTTPPKTEKMATTAGADSGAPPPVKIPPVALSIGEQMYQVALANGDPMAGITKAIYDDMITKEAEQRQNALLSLGASIQGAEQEYNDTQSFIDKWVNIATKNSNNLTDLLQTQNEETNKVLEQQKSNALQKLEFDRQVEVQKAEKQKAQDILKSSIAIGLRGGAYSGAAQNAIADAEREWDNNISNLSKEFSFKAADVVTDFTSKYVTAKQNLALNLFNASETLSNKIEGYANAGFTSLQAKKKSIIEAKNAYRTTLDTIAKDHAKEVKDLGKEMAERVNKKRDDDRAQAKEAKDNAYKFFEFAFSESTDPAVRRAAVTQMTNAGYNMPSDIDMNADPVSFQLATMNNLAKQSQNSASDPFRFTGEGAQVKQSLAASALTVIGQLEGGVEMNRAQLDYVNKLLDFGKIDEAKTRLRGLAVAALKGTQENAFTARRVITGASDALLEDLKKIENTSKGQTLFKGLKEAASLLVGKTVSELTADDFTAYKKSVLNLRKKLGTEGDKDLQRIFAQVENIAGVIINERYGAAVSEGEQERAREYIAMSGNTLSEMIIKLEEFSKFSKQQNEEMLNTKMGLIGDQGMDEPNYSPAPPSDEDFNIMFLPKGGIPEEDAKIETGYVSGVVTGYGSKYWKAGLDIAATKGAPIKTPSGGKVVAVVNDYKVGYPNDPDRGKKQNRGFGNQVAIQYPDGVKLQFSHLAGTDISEGEIPAGATIGYVGNTGNTYGATGVHVDVTGFKKDGSLMTAQEVAEYMQKSSNSSIA